MIKLFTYENFKPKKLEGRKSKREIEIERDHASINIIELFMDSDLSDEELKKYDTFKWISNNLITSFRIKHLKQIKDLCSRIKIESYNCYESDVDGEGDYYEIVISGKPQDVHLLYDLLKNVDKSGISIVGAEEEN